MGQTSGSSGDPCFLSNRNIGVALSSGDAASRNVYTLRTLGVSQVVDAERRAHDAILSQPRRFALLVYLAASEREYQSRNSLAALFWPNASEAHARGALKQAVFAIRRTFGADVIISRGSFDLGINGDVLRCDVRQFRDAFRESRFHDVVALYGGDFLESFRVDAGPEFQSWVDAQRTGLAEHYRLALAARKELPVASSVANTPAGIAGSRAHLRSVAIVVASVVAVATVAAATRRR